MKTKAKHIHEYTTQKSGIKTCTCGRFQHKEGGEVIVEQRARHTATPWQNVGYEIYDKNRNVILDCGLREHLTNKEAGANAEFIVRAVNSHDALVEACKRGLGFAKQEDYTPLIALFEEVLKQAEVTK